MAITTAINDFKPTRERDVDDQPRAAVSIPLSARHLEPDVPPLEPKPVLSNPDGTPNRDGWRKIGEQFRKEMTSKSRAGRGGKSFNYVTARQVAKRLDDVVGPGNWSTDWQCIRSEHPVAVRVGLSVFGVWRWDAGYSNNPEADDETDKAYEDEPLKAAVSDGFKRAAVQFGIGRFLYGDT